MPIDFDALDLEEFTRTDVQFSRPVRNYDQGSFNETLDRTMAMQTTIAMQIYGPVLLTVWDAKDDVRIGDLVEVQ